MTEPALRVEGLTRRFGATVAVDALSFHVDRGELFGLVGPDGAGKTTTLRMLAGVMRPDAGEIVMLGIRVTREPERIRSRVAYMSQRFGLYTDLTVMENLEFYADLYRVPRAERQARLERLFRFSGLEPFRARIAGQLSGGMKQKLGLSCALIHEPDVLLLDEPTFGVDPISRRDLWLIVHEMVGHGTTVVVSTAYMDEAERFDRVAFLDRGRLLALETPERLRREITGELLAVSLDRAREARAAAVALPEVRRAAVFGDRLHLSVASAERDGPVVRAALARAGFPVRELTAIEPSMEDVFIDRIAGRESRA